MIELDGSVGEGGGQVLRTALTLSMITGQAFRIVNIRANRAKPGLMRQHLVAVQAAAQVSDAQLTQAEVGSQMLEFTPGKIRGGDYDFAIGTAGSSTLVLQTLLPALLFADAPSVVRVSGGTHNPLAPPVHFLQRAYGRVLAEMGANVGIELKRFGFYPAGGGEVLSTIQPCSQLRSIDLTTRGKLLDGFAESFISRLPLAIAERELESVGKGMGWDRSRLRACSLPADQGPGNALLITLEHEYVTEVFCSFGEKTVRAENVASKLLQEAGDYLASDAAVGEYLADQIMLLLALAGGGQFTTHTVSSHATTNAVVIGQFLPIQIAFDKQESHVACILGQPGF